MLTMTSSNCFNMILMQMMTYDHYDDGSSVNIGGDKSDFIFFSMRRSGGISAGLTITNLERNEDETVVVVSDLIDDGMWNDELDDPNLSLDPTVELSSGVASIWC